MGAITITGDFTETKEAVKKMNKGLPQVKELTKKDFKGRVPAQVRKGARAKYKASKKINEAKPSWHDTGDFSGKLDYKTVPIGIENFGMSPKEAPGRQEEPTFIPALKARVRLPLPYTISYAIKKPTQIGFTKSGRRKMASHKHKFESTKGYFIARGLVWKRTGPNAKSVEVMKTLSVSAMIVNDAKSEIEKNIEETMDKRVENHIKNKMELE